VAGRRKLDEYLDSVRDVAAWRLDAIQEGERTALDNSMVLKCSSMMAGANHDNDQLPMVMLGRAGREGSRRAACSTTRASRTGRCTGSIPSYALRDRFPDFWAID